METVQHGSARHGFRGPSLEHIWFVLPLVVVFVLTSTHPIRPHDFWWHLRAGADIVHTGRIPAVDTYSFTRHGAPYPSYQAYWLADVVLYVVYSAGGPALVVFCHSLIITGAYGIMLALCWSISRSTRVAAACTLVSVALGFDSWNVRPQAVGFLFGAVVIFAVYRLQPQASRAPGKLGVGGLTALAFAMLLWVNCHGSFVVGLAIVGLALAADIWRVMGRRLGFCPSRRCAAHSPQTACAGGQRLAAPVGPSVGNLGEHAKALVVCAAVCLLNPRGVGIVRYVAGITTNPVVRAGIVEWLPPSFGTRAGATFMVVFLLSVALLMLSPRRPTAFELSTFLVFGAFGLSTARGVPWFGLVAAPILADHIPALWAEVGGERGLERGRQEGEVSPGEVVANYVIVALLSGALVLCLPWLKHYLPLSEAKAGLVSSETPVEATRFLLRRRPQGPLFHAMDFGSYLIWTAQPAYPVFVDPRIELYPPSLWRDYDLVSAAGPGWNQCLARYGVNALMLDRERQAPLVAAATESPQWRQIYLDSHVSLYARLRPLRRSPP